eukprot:CAMPEP_0175946140 /NCGR_PEP_ID=MMETSP0108-20121206/27128_1 /TAXON_ID=195067 ORGANISM="Goniomonas pacifica, Strain CCMP1869" /NCGR_SAMPLE_ID=MMETSP0108 /ASSEMBLY_ACC=CAM_ASM_000204 /LENGTH=50 /DNA_ID=CAMNT_0017271553 /DNA_START=26 /DNA_END=175 /DNA_ORIENTATION=-
MTRDLELSPSLETLFLGRRGLLTPPLHDAGQGTAKRTRTHGRICRSSLTT